jgi:glutamate dehydrogenase
MPFLVDSIRIALNRLGLSPHLMLSATLKIIRDDNLEVTALTPIFNKDLEVSSEETVFFIEIDRQANVQDLDMIKQTLLSVVEDSPHRC